MNEINPSEFEIKEIIDNRNFFYSLILGISLPLLLIQTYKNIDFFNKVANSNLKSLFIYLFILIYIVLNSYRYLRGIFQVHKFSKYIANNYPPKEYKKMDYGKFFNYGIAEIFLQFFLIISIFRDFNGAFRFSITEELLIPTIQVPDVLVDEILKFCVVFFVVNMALVLIDMCWIRVIKKSELYKIATKKENKGVISDNQN